MTEDFLHQIAIGLTIVIAVAAIFTGVLMWVVA
ncbi:MAG: hypothetical protein RL661_907 [Pseudomonadota bacterium]|jgi:hypothetical protein